MDKIHCELGLIVGLVGTHSLIEFAVQRHERIDSDDVTLILSLSRDEAPRLLYFGARLPDDMDVAELEVTLAPGSRESTPDRQIEPNIFPTNGWGWMGEPAIGGRAQERQGPLRWSRCDAERNQNGISVKLSADDAGIQVSLEWALDPATGILSASTIVRNVGKDAYNLNSLASIYLPLPAPFSDILAFDGDWSREVQPVRFQAPPGIWRRTNRTGRTGFAGATMLVVEPGASDFNGRMIAVHLAWSGSHQLTVDTLADGSRSAIAQALLEDGEVQLAPGEAFTAPTAYACASASGFNGLSNAFHAFVRLRILPERPSTVRKVHFNTWESTYFDFDEKVILELADHCAAIGIERFVLDDGWFSNRRNDKAALGDWRVDAKLFPSGLKPLIDRIQAHEMDFGLWVEPEMVSPDSQLYREHPDWCVHVPGGERPTMRNQLWLDMSRADVREHLFEQIDALLSGYEISYLKWDCNRFQFPTGGAALVRGTYALLDRIRAAHPAVEIESCASGGGRIDLEILKRTTRVWPSDTTDAIERLRIQRWNGLVLPPEVIGAHVGPSPNPITGRVLDMNFRARVALFGHFGVEVDPRGLCEGDRQSLARHIELYKQHRRLIHSGRMHFWTTADGADARATIAQDGSEALVLACRAETGGHALSVPLMLRGLEDGRSYRVTPIEPWPRIAGKRLEQADVWRRGRTFSGAVLGKTGLRLPLSDPQTAWLLHLERLD